MESIVRDWVRVHWGKRCKAYARGCGVCDAWVAYDFLFNIESLKLDHETGFWYPRDIPLEEGWAEPHDSTKAAGVPIPEENPDPPTKEDLEAN